MLNELLKRPVIPVIVIEDANDAEPLAEALLKGGMDVIEVTCRTAAAPEALARIKKSFPGMLLGAGTVVTPDQAKMCIDTGVSFGLAPGLNPDTVKFFQDHSTLFIPGVMTPSEIEKGLSLGLKMLKFFPAGAAGGVNMLKNLAAPYGPLGVKFCPTGGVNLDNMQEWLSQPVVSAIGGSWLATKQQIADKQWDVITDQVKAALAKAAELAD
ncbi:bifunctional 4-hydroxy-2-oxoglutarate aldolase/2-dehydro-3-deoxy-phosphogluconate aldolase [Tichowtungia aerotolerans]|uniref:Bifunctional 4-hydroxy-2-oxoglutarate aldolase/2-dehydro-3-deoxy-phosphogluconate aldolase n=1 Tax=Tichowtungia aerotolerans TaxID=2697043 RepID=A0A6P1MB59_9BACT|nr:bifunctional 4-hydroxy-2-oxoglutarate aldolase/2-dehydro-3-deoxy-phosphogluconate aldolase [Tichowtungia aerotolerans]QHI68796.1 bifunctional 4-hydroxy-2-oxoglutarate aldolase/2-dehydro-3-deoxy-phosphogluconate aldolase [Tichowtungia aerotolerans]